MENKFRETFNLGDIQIPYCKLEDALIDKYGDFKIVYFKGFKTTNDYGIEEEYESNYSCMCGENWGSYKYETTGQYKTSRDSLLGLFIEHKNQLKRIVDNVCKTKSSCK